jgi:simple sugar transport system ATP-binding protein
VHNFNMQQPIATSPPRLALRGIVKRYPTVVANDHVDLTVRVGEIHGLIGENGAGKSTLMMIACGVVRPDGGTIEWEGREVPITTPAVARQLGIGMVFQHFALFETLTVVENIALALDEKSDSDTLRARIREISQRYGVPVEPDRLVHSMSVGERQRVEIVRCLLQSPRLLIMDEPTSVLTPRAVTRLFETLRHLAAEGVSILYVSHKLDEVRALCDTATVMRDGRVVATVQPAAETNESLARMMVGKDVSACRLTPRTPGEVRLELRGFSKRSWDPFGTTLHAIDLQVRSGEIVGIAGVSGNGQKELLACLCGETAGADAGSLHLCGQAADTLSVAARRELGLTFVPEERLDRGVVASLSLASNALLTGARHGMVSNGFVRDDAARAFARETIKAFDVRVGSEQSSAESLSGGNLQKFIVGREARLDPKVMIVAQPTWGVDVGAAQLIHQALIDLRDRGVAVLVISEELEELFEICDRIAVLAQGRLSRAEPRASLTTDAVGVLMAGAGNG